MEAIFSLENMYNLVFFKKKKKASSWEYKLV